MNFSGRQDMRQMRGTRGLTWLMGAALAVCAGILVAGATVERAAAHGGGQDKFGGHVEKATGKYHCHGKPGTAKRARCDMRVQVSDLTAAVKAGAAERAWLLEQIRVKDLAASVKARELNAALSENTLLERSLGTARRAARDANHAAAAARAHAETARRDMREAEARARGRGPAVSSRCKDGVVAAIDDSGWTFSRAEKAALRRACLE